MTLSASSDFRNSWNAGSAWNAAPVLFPYLPAGMRHKIDECVSKSRIIVGYPITDDIEIVLGL